MFIAEIHLAHPDLALSHTIEAVPRMEIDLEYQAITGPGRYHLFFKVSGDDFAAFEAAVDEDPTVTESTLILDADTFRVYRMRLLATDYLVLPKAAEYGIRVLHARSGEKGWVGKLEVPEAEALRAFRDFCTGKGIEFTIERIYRTEYGDGDGEGEFGLTDVQRETLVAAYEAGYFNEPRDASLQEVADRLGVSSSSASGRLRRAVAVLIERTLLGDRER